MALADVVHEAQEPCAVVYSQGIHTVCLLNSSLDFCVPLLYVQYILCIELWLVVFICSLNS